MHSREKLRYLVAAFIAVLLLATVANLAFTLTQAHRRILQGQEATVEKLVHLLEQQTAESLDAVELTLKSSARNFQALQRQGKADDAAVRAMLMSGIGNLSFVQAIWILDPGGNVIHDVERLPGKYGLSDRGYFSAHKDNPHLGLYIDGPLPGKQGARFIRASMRIDRPDGGFGGVIAAAFEPGRLARFFEAVKPGRTGTIALVDNAGNEILRFPNAGGAPERKPEHAPLLNGTMNDAAYRATSGVDEVRRIYASRRIPGRPLAVMIGLGEEEALAPWRNIACTYTVVSAIFLVVLACLGQLVLLEWRRRSELHEVLARSETDLAAAQRLSKTGSWTFDFRRHIGKWSSEMYSVLGMRQGEVPPLPVFLSRIHPDDREEIKKALYQEASWCIEVRTNPQHGPIRYLLSRGERIRNAGGELTGTAGTLQDVTGQRSAEEKLKLAARVFDRMQDGIVVTDDRGRVMATNDACERITGYREDEVTGRNARIFLSHRGNRQLRAILVALRETGEWAGEIWGRRKNGASGPQWLTVSSILDARGRRSGYVGVFTDLSKIREANAQLTFLSLHDALTRLPNRRLLHDRLQQAIEGARLENRTVAVLLLSPDKLRRINSTLGQDIGDAVLCEISARIRHLVPHGDSVGRSAGDEFTVILAHIRDAAEAITLSHRLLDAVAAPLHLEQRALRVTASIGISVFPADGNDAATLMKNAAIALAHAKQQGGNGMRFYRSEMNAAVMRRVAIEQELRRTAVCSEFSLLYQPQLRLTDRHVCGLEALLRWHSPTLGKVSPAEFIPIAEDAGLIAPIGNWVIHEACRQIRTWADEAAGSLSVAVNVSSHQFSSGKLVDAIRDAIAMNRISSGQLEIELTETALMENADIAARQISALRDLGIRVALDDFGTGYASLSYLSDFEFDKLKIDQSFVRNITTNRRSAAVAKATASLARGLGMKVIAEGVETEEQLSYLRAIGCDEIQGYIFSEPLPAREVTDLTRTARC